MSLTPVAGTPGHWRDPGWDGNSPGTFAILIGCSRYPWLKGGQNVGPAPMKWIKEAQKLGQLYVSALTARRVFDWMCWEYAMDDAPPVSCRLLLSPTGEELIADPEIGTHPLDPTLANCKAAITASLADINALPEPAREKSRLIFFFSGHGLQSTIDRQILLPSDYLGDGLPSFNHALSTKNLLNGLNIIKVPYRYYFLDACRNDTDEIRQLQPKGDEFLPEYPTYHSYQKIEVDALLYATTAAQRAWQPTDPKEGPTLFGQALLDGLRGTPNIRLEQEDGKKAVKFFNLESYMNGRIAELLKTHQSTAHQVVQPGGLARPRVVTQLPKILPEEVAGEGFPLPSPPGDLSDLIHLSDLSYEGDAPGAPLDWLEDVIEFEEDSVNEEAPEEAGAAEGAAEDGRTGEAPEPPEPPAPRRKPANFEFSYSVPIKQQTQAWRQDFNLGHSYFGHETTTALFAHTLRVASLCQLRWLRNDEVRLLRVDRSEMPGEGEGLGQTRYRIALGVSHFDERGHWLQLFGARGTGSGVLLPMDDLMFRSGMAEYVLRVDVTHLGGPEVFGPEISALTAAPMAVGSGPVVEATRLWHRYQGESADRAVSDFEGSRLEKLLQRKAESPLAAIIAALVLLRADRLDLMHDWVRNVADWFPEFADGPVLWAELILRQGTDPKKAARDAAKSLARLSQRGLPVTGEALSYAATLMDRLSRDLQIMDDETRISFLKAKAEVDDSLAYFRPGGLFASFVNFEAKDVAIDQEDRVPGPGPRSIDFEAGGLRGGDAFLGFGESN